MNLNVGIIGLGTVGSGVVEILESRISWLKSHYDIDLKIAGLCAREEEILAQYPHYFTTQNAFDLVENPEIHILVELVGGYDLPLKWLTAALESGKHVVTANKALLAKHGKTLFPLASQMQKDIRFEAAVAGGIPIIKALQESLSGNEILSLYGIINGTCNYIVNEIEAKGISFDVALKDAQEKGYAEADPTFDVEGIDACHKLALLGSICSRSSVDFEAIPTQGIRAIQPIDLEILNEMGYTIKLLGVYKKIEEQVALAVHPMVIAKSHLLANVNGVLNAVYLETDSLGPALFTGAGAGRYPTASAVVGDIFDLAIDIRSGLHEPVSKDYFATDTKADLLDSGKLESRFYLRIVSEDVKGVLAKITNLLSQGDISIESVIQKAAVGGNRATIIVVTHKCIEKNLFAALEQIEKLDEVGQACQAIRFLD